MPQTPLCSVNILREDAPVWGDVREEMDQALRTMRIDVESENMLKTIDACKNPLLEKRKRRQTHQAS